MHLSGRPDDILLPFARRNGFSYTLAELTRLMRESGISKGMLLSPPLGGGRPLPNDEVMTICRDSGGLLSPVLTVVPTKEGVTSAISMAKRNLKVVKGFKILLGYFRVFAHSPVFRPLYDLAEEEELPVLFHTGDTADSGGSLVHSHPLTLDALANARPGLRMVACHFGNPWIEDVGELLYKHENLYADVSGLSVGEGRYSVRYGESLARRVSEAIYFAGGADKVIFGSDYPVTSQTSALALVARLDIDPADRRKVLAGNAKRVFRL
jgi:hypothetical protein